MAEEKKLRFKIVKQLEGEKDRGVLYGWVSAADIVDSQDEFIPYDEFVDMIHEFMMAYYKGEASVFQNHEGEARAVIVESAPQYFGGTLRWYVGVKLLDDDLKELARQGKVTGFSIGGWSDKIEVGDAESIA